MRLNILLVVVMMTGCPRPPGQDESSGASPQPTERERPRLAHPAGGSCAGRDDCASDQVCVDTRCRYRKTSVAGEAFAEAAHAQRLAGDIETALRSYDLAEEAFEQADAPVPADVLCGAALVAFARTSEAAEREQAAKRAWACFRGSLPGDPARAEVLAVVSRLRYAGLDVAAFDAREEPERFFTEQTSRPTVDAIEISLSLEEAREPGFEAVARALESDAARRLLADCFLQDWEESHEDSVRASALLQFDTRMRDMGEYEVHVGAPSVSPTSLAQPRFESCASTALSGLLRENPMRLAESASWKVPFEVRAHLR